jgi:hypothetical protein
MPDIRWKILHPGYSDEVVASLALFVAAAAALLLVALTNRSDMTSATLVLCGFACFIGGLFLLTFHRGETLPPDVAARLAPGAGIGLARIAAALGVDGDAVILPVLGGDPVQFNPSGASGIPDGTVSSTLVVHEGSVGLSIPPPALLLWHHLRLEFGLVTPDGVEAALSAYRETLLVSLELADSVKTAIVGDDLMIEIIGYHLFDGCRILHEESPKICTMFPCAICGLAGLILVDGTGSAWIFDRIALNAETRSVLITLRQHASP